VTRRLVKQLLTLGVTGIRTPDEAQLRDAVDTELYRERQASSELEELIAPSQRRLVSALAKRDGSDPALFEPLSPVTRLRLNDWARREGVVVALRARASETSGPTAELTKLRDEIASRAKAAAESNAALKLWEREARAARDECRRLASQQEAWEAERAMLKQQIVRSCESIAGLEEQLAELETLRLKIMELESLLAEKDSAIARNGNRIAALKDEIRRDDAYLGKLRSHFENLHEDVERRLAVMLQGARAAARIETERATVLLRHERTSSLKALFDGIRATLTVDQSAATRWPSLYLHYLLGHRRQDAGDLALLAASGLFDPVYYLEHNEDVAKSGVDPLIHYVDLGAARGANPSALFDTVYYTQTNPDVARSQMNPLRHFIVHGRRERRLPRPKPSLNAPLGDWTLPPPPVRRVDKESLKPTPRRIVIYTAVAGGYDDLQAPLVRPPNCDLVAFSDQALEVEGWQVRPFNYLHQDPTRAARFVKLHPHVYFPDYDHSIWVDANIGVRGDIREFCERLIYDSSVGIFIHPLRDCVYVEADECIKREKDDPEVIKRHVARYRAEGFPENAGLWETNVVVRRHNDPDCIALMTAWWREMEIGSRRDQLSLPVAVRSSPITIAPLGKPGENAREHALVTLTKHPVERKIAGDGPLPAAIRRTVDVDSIPIDIGVCVHNSPDETKACLESLIAARRPQDRLVVVDDASDAPTARLIDQLAKDHEGITLIRHERNRGYTRSANEVLKNAKGRWIVLLNSDTIVPAPVLRKLITCGEQFSRLGIVGPLSNAASWQTVPQLTGMDGKFLVNELPAPLTADDMDRICGELSYGTVPFVPLLNGFCLAIRRMLIGHIGLFDEESFPMGYGEEDDFCLRAGAAGFLCGLATDAYVYHHKSASFTAERRLPLVEAGQRALRVKHSVGRVAAAVYAMKHHPELACMRERISEAIGMRIAQAPVAEQKGNDQRARPVAHHQAQGGDKISHLSQQ
jgi:GT2 family glycosyltransferase